MKTSLSFLLSFCALTTTMAQKADSLKAVFQNTRADTTKVIVLSLLADELTKSDPAKAIETARQGISLAHKAGFERGLFENYMSLASAYQGQALFDSSIVNFQHAFALAVHRADVTGQAEACSALGHSFMRKTAMDSARHYLDKGLTLARQAKNYKIEAGIYNNYGNVLLEEGDYARALDYFIQAARLYENPLHDNLGRCLALSNIGNIEYRLGNYDKALDYARQSMAIATDKKFPSSIGYAHKLLGRIYRKQQKLDEALREYEQGQKVYLMLGDTRSAAELLLNTGNIYYDKIKYRKALANYVPALTLAKRIASKPLIAHAYSSIGQTYGRLNENHNALRYLDSSRVAATAAGNAYLVMDSYEAMSSVYEVTGDYKKALAMQQQFVQMKDSLTRSENRQLAEETQAKYELEKKETQIALLEKDRALKNLDLERHRAIQVGIGIALALVIVIALLLVNRYRVGNRIKRLAEIEQVRNTIARDLHDDIGSTLSTINIISKLAMHENPKGNNLHLSRIAEQSAQMMESMTDIVWSINPDNDSLEKIAARMHLFTGEILEPQNIGYRFMGTESLTHLTLDTGKRKNLFLIFKEAVNNAAKYSGATEVEILLSHTEGKLRMTVSDNGCGFDEARINPGNGVKNMKARAQAINAHLALITAAGHGTRIELVLPIT
jgi:two-component system sensor histidine kinase UhpB